MKKVFSKKNPSNSRIYIDVKSKKVSFSYPNKKSEFYIVLNFITSIFLSITSVFITVNLPILVFYILSKPILASTFTAKNSFYLIPEFIFFFSEIIYLLLFILFFSTFVFISSDRLMSKMPELNKKLAFLLGSNIKSVKISKLDSNIFEIPIFDNVFLEYKATNDFQKYLKNVEIIEHDFYYLNEPNIYKQLFGFKKKKIKNDDYWKVRFIFDKIPKKGWLEVIYM